MAKILKHPLVILASIGIGIALGIWAKPVAVQLAPIGSLYLYFIQMCVFPILIVAISSSLATMIRNKEAAGSLGRMTLVFLIFLVAVAFLGVVVGEVAQPGRNLDDQTMATLGKIVTDPSKSALLEVELFGEESVTKSSTGILDFLNTLIPKNIFESLSLGNALEIVFFSIIFGLALGFIRENPANQLITLTVSLFEAFQKLIAWAMYGLPFGLICLLADQIASVGVEIFGAMFKFIIIFYVGGLFLFLLSTVIIWIRSGIRNPLKVLRALVDPIMISLATRSSFAALPSSIEAMEEKLGFDGTTANLALPLGTTIGRFGNIFYFAIAAFFVIQIYNTPLDLSGYLMVVVGSIFAGIATAGASGVLTLGMIGIILTPLGLPVEAVLIIFMAIDAIVDPMRTLLIVYVNIATTSLIAKRPGTEPQVAEAGNGDARLASPASRRSNGPRTLRVAVLDHDIPVFLTTGADGKLGGLDVLLVDELARRTGRTIELRRNYHTHDEILEALADGEAELGVSRIQRGSGTDSRAFLSVPYVTVNRNGKREMISMAVSRNEEKLAMEINTFLRELHKEGFMEQAVRGTHG